MPLGGNARLYSTHRVAPGDRLENTAYNFDKLAGFACHEGKSMETRIARLEEFATDAKERLARIEARQAELADKVGALQVEMHKGFADMIKWVVGTAIVLGGTALTVITFVLNNATPKPSPTTPPSVVVYTQPVPVQPAK